MNKTAIKNFAIWARNKLIAEIQYKAGLLGITDKEIKSPLQQSTPAVQFFDIGTKEPYSITGVEISQRRKLAEEIRHKADSSDYPTAYKAVIEEVAYTWFNRLIAVRFMEVNDYLPTRIRVLSSESAGKTEPDLVTQAQEADFDYTPYEKDRIAQLQQGNRLDELFRMLFIKQCNALNALLPDLFEKTDDFTELLLNISFTDWDGVVCRLVSDIPEDDFNVSKEGQVEIIGWLYQYYNTELNELIYDGSLSKNRIPKELLPAATTIYTPDWAIRYMVENSLGRLWLEGHPNDSLKSGWKYFLDEAEQEAEVQAQLTKIHEEYKKIKPEEIKVIDPCMGSGHILVYAFDVLMQIYESCGYSQRDAARSIVEKNLYGLDIDQRAYQLAYFAVMMKARQYNRRVLSEGIHCNLYAIEESNGINREQLQYFGQGMNELERNVVLPQMDYLLDTMKDAKEYGSILKVEPLNWSWIREFVRSAEFHGQMSFDTVGLEDTQEKLKQLVEIAVVLTEKYDVVVTNPPYLGSSRFSPKLSDFVNANYADVKSEMAMVMFKRAITGFSKENGFISFITTTSWMFLKSFDSIREYVLQNTDFDSLVDFGTELFDGKVGHNPIVSWITRKHFTGKKMTAIRLVEYCYSRRNEKESQYFAVANRHYPKQENFSRIPGMPIAYWVSKNTCDIFAESKPLNSLATVKHGLSTGKNELFVRYWAEVNYPQIDFSLSDRTEIGYSNAKYFPYNKGGLFRKWYGNAEYVLWYDVEGQQKMASLSGHRHDGKDRYFHEGITWSFISSSRFGVRYTPTGFVFDVAGSCLFSNHEMIMYITGLLCSKLGDYFLTIQNPTLNFQVGNLSKIPVKVSDQANKVVADIAKANISISKTDWDSFETSWNFIRHPLARNTRTIVEAFDQWHQFTKTQFAKIKANEEEINRIFIDIYGLQDELTPDVEDKDITIRRADLGRDIRSFLSYAVGCMFGRYSLDVDGLAYAGGEWDGSKYGTFIPDKDNVLPITDEEYFEDDIVGLFVAFVKKVYGAATLEENLDFIAQALGNKGNSSREVIRNYFLKDFFKNHCQIYQKRPIYWLFDSGKADGFKALIYMHRYNADTIGKLRIDYLHRMQRIYESEIVRMQETIHNSKDAREVAAATKRKEKLVKQLQETKVYDEKIAHLALARIEIDLDDGVVVNYEKLQTGADGRKLEVLAKI